MPAILLALYIEQKSVPTEIDMHALLIISAGFSFNYLSVYESTVNIYWSL